MVSLRPDEIKFEVYPRKMVHFASGGGGSLFSSSGSTGFMPGLHDRFISHTHTQR